MRLFGLEITRARPPAPAPATGGVVKASEVPLGLSSAAGWTGWLPLIRESFAGAWQRGVKVTATSALAYSAVFSCVTLISGDIGKIASCLRLVEQDSSGIWKEVEVAAFSPVLRKPNNYQNRIQFITQWVLSKLIHGNAYVLKVRDNRGAVVQMHVLDPLRVKPLVAPNGDVYYDLSGDYLAGLSEAAIVPAREIIHDRWNCLFHPLVGVSPIYACGVSAVGGLNIQNSQARFFGNGARPSGVLTAPGKISDDVAARIKEAWEENFGGENVGRTAVLGDGLAYAAMTMTAVDAQLIEQLKWSAETVCSCYHVPAYMVGAAPAPAYNNIEALNQQYYAQCLQVLIEALELCLDEGLGLPTVAGHTYGVEFDLDTLLRMDSATLIKTLTEGLKGVYASNEARKKLNLPPVKGGDAVLSQQQNYSLEALAKRDAQEDPFAKETGAAPAWTDATAPAPAAEGDPSKVIDLWAVRKRAKGKLDARLRRTG